MATADAFPAAGLSRAAAAPPLWTRLRPRLRRPRPAAPRPLAPEAVEFQEPLEQVIGERPPPWLRGPHHLAALLLLALVLAAALLRTDIVVTATGRLATDGPPLVLQPLERSVIREIRVRPGDAVQRGQVLAVLDPTFARADRAALEAQRRQARAEQARLEAELAGQPLPLPAAPAMEELLQATLHAQRQAQYTARLRGFDEEIGSQEAALRGTRESLALLAGQLALAGEVEGVRARLMESQVGSRLNYLGARSQRLAAEQEHSAAQNRATELQHNLEARRAARQAFLDEWRRDLLESLLRARAELARLEEALTKAARIDELTLLTAPEDGVVLEVARRSAGSVLREAEPLVTLVPAGRPLIAEITLASADIGYPHPGDAVVLKVDAFPYQRHGTLQGRLRSIAQDSYAPGLPAGSDTASAGGAVVHRGQVEILTPRLPGMPEAARLIPGMSLSAEIQVGTRSLLSFFLEPLTRGLQEAVREP